MIKQKQIIAVNATAISTVSGGLLNILNQFLDETNINKNFIYYVFTSSNLIHESANIRKIIVKKKGWINRLPWDFYGFANWFKSRNISPKYIISLQNNPVIFNGVHQYYYIQTPFPFVYFPWRLLSKEERVLWFYQKILPLFIKLTSTKLTSYIVQSAWMKSVVIKRLNFSDENIMIVRPDEKIKQFSREETSINNGYINIFYPASSYRHKNHDLLIDILLHLKETNIKIFNKVKIFITIENDLNTAFCKKLRLNNLEGRFHFLGYTSENTVFNYYEKCDALIFPSIMESFGLPLSEAKQFNLPILAIDLPYVYEAVGYYDKLITIKQNDLKRWGDSIINLSNNNLTYNTIKQQDNDIMSWKNFHDSFV